MKTLLIILALVMFKSGFAFAYYPDSAVKNSYQDNGCLTLYTDTIPVNNINIKPFHLEIVAPSSGVQFYRNGIVFLAYSKDAEKMSQKHLSFGSVTPFMALIADTLLGQYMPFLSSSPLMFPAEATAFSKDFNTMYLSLIPEKDTREKIFRAAYTNNGWVIDDSPLSFCNEDYLYTHPALSNDGDFLIFSSNMQGSSGGLDLYISRKTDEKWSVPENLGQHINTSGNELFASLDEANNLYFSSDRLPGQGGYDIFVCAYDGKGWGKPQNLSQTINSPDDEVAFTMNRDNGKSAFYTSRERSGKREMQLYRITLNPLITTAATQNLSKQLLAMTGMKEQSQEAPAMVPEAKKTAEIIKETKPEPVNALAGEGKRDILVYRIQYASNTRTLGSQKVTIAGKNYKSYEYLYKGGYRSTVGEFSTLAEASIFVNLCRQSGYNQSFLVAFNNGERITDAEARVLEAQLSGTVRPEISKASEPPVQTKPSEIKTDTKSAATPSENKEGIIYRVQILANTRPVGSYNLIVSGKSYKTFEYLYMGGYRTAIGESSTLKEAAKLQNVCKQSGYKEAFIVAFKDNVRTNDPAFFK